MMNTLTFLAIKEVVEENVTKWWAETKGGVPKDPLGRPLDLFGYKPTTAEITGQAAKDIKYDAEKFKQDATQRVANLKEGVSSAASSALKTAQSAVESGREKLQNVGGITGTPDPAGTSDPGGPPDPENPGWR